MPTSLFTGTDHRSATVPQQHHIPYALALASKMIDVARHDGLDLLHVHYAIPHATSAVLARDILRSMGISIPIVTTLHGTDITLVGKDAGFQPVVEHSIDASDGVTSVSDWLRRETYASFDVSAALRPAISADGADTFLPLID